MSPTPTPRRTKASTERPPAAAKGAARRDPRPRRARRALWPMLVTIAFIGFLFLFVFPTRALVAQRASISSTQHQLDVLNRENATLAARAKALNTDAEIEQIARQQYNLVRPGEEAYAILPAPQAPATVPNVWPFHGVQAHIDQSP